MTTPPLKELDLQVQSLGGIGETVGYERPDWLNENLGRLRQGQQVEFDESAEIYAFHQVQKDLAALKKEQELGTMGHLVLGGTNLVQSFAEAGIDTVAPLVETVVDTAFDGAGYIAELMGDEHLGKALGETEVDATTRGMAKTLLPFYDMITGSETDVEEWQKSLDDVDAFIEADPVHRWTRKLSAAGGEMTAYMVGPVAGVIGAGTQATSAALRPLFASGFVGLAKRSGASPAIVAAAFRRGGAQAAAAEVAKAVAAKSVVKRAVANLSAQMPSMLALAGGLLGEGFISNRAAFGQEGEDRDPNEEWWEQRLTSGLLSAAMAPAIHLSGLFGERAYALAAKSGNTSKLSRLAAAGIGGGAESLAFTSLASPMMIWDSFTGEGEADWEGLVTDFVGNAFVMGLMKRNAGIGDPNSLRSIYAKDPLNFMDIVDAHDAKVRMREDVADQRAEAASEAALSAEADSLVEFVRQTQEAEGERQRINEEDPFRPETETVERRNELDELREDMLQRTVEQRLARAEAEGEQAREQELADLRANIEQRSRVEARRRALEVMYGENVAIRLREELTDTELGLAQDAAAARLEVYNSIVDGGLRPVGAPREGRFAIGDGAVEVGSVRFEGDEPVMRLTEDAARNIFGDPTRTEARGEDFMRGVMGARLMGAQSRMNGMRTFRLDDRYYETHPGSNIYRRIDEPRPLERTVDHEGTIYRRGEYGKPWKVVGKMSQAQRAPTASSADPYFPTIRSWTDVVKAAAADGTLSPSTARAMRETLATLGDPRSVKDQASRDARDFLMDPAVQDSPLLTFEGFAGERFTDTLSRLASGTIDYDMALREVQSIQRSVGYADNARQMEVSMARRRVEEDLARQAERSGLGEGAEGAAKKSMSLSQARTKRKEAIASRVRQLQGERQRLLEEGRDVLAEYGPNKKRPPEVKARARERVEEYVMVEQEMVLLSPGLDVDSTTLSANRVAKDLGVSVNTVLKYRRDVQDLLSGKADEYSLQRFIEDQDLSYDEALSAMPEAAASVDAGVSPYIISMIRDLGFRDQPGKTGDDTNTGLRFCS